jgi:hypothetical protein
VVEAEKRDGALPSVLFWTTFNMLHSQCVTKMCTPRERKYSSYFRGCLRVRNLSARKVTK